MIHLVCTIIDHLYNDFARPDATTGFQVGLSGTRLTTDQLRELLNSLATDSCKVTF